MIKNEKKLKESRRKEKKEWIEKGEEGMERERKRRNG